VTTPVTIFKAHGTPCVFYFVQNKWKSGHEERGDLLDHHHGDDRHENADDGRGDDLLALFDAVFALCSP
jgi:hypothetical protein